MKSDLVLLVSRDPKLQQQSAKAAFASGARSAIARGIGEALQIVCQRRRELDLIVVDFDNGIRGMALLSALGMSRDQLPIVALTSTDRDRSAELAYADGAACCLTRPINAAEFEMVIRLLANRHSKQRSQKMRKDSQFPRSNFGPLPRTSNKCKRKQNAPRVLI